MNVYNMVSELIAYVDKLPQLFSIVTFLASLATVRPVLNYWKLIFNEESFQTGTELIWFAIFRFIFDMSVFYFFLKNTSMSSVIPSLIPLFLIIQLFFFSLCTLAIPLLYLVSVLSVELKKKNIFNKIDKPHKRWQNFYNKYFRLADDIGDEFVLSTECSKILLIVSYLISGILTASNTANGLILSIYKTNENISKAFDPIFSNDRQLYCSIFIISFMPIFTAYILNSKGKEHHTNSPKKVFFVSVKKREKVTVSRKK